MSDKEIWRKALQEDRLQHQLELQSRQIERVFTRHQLSAHVAGGTVRPRLISFDLQEQLTSGWEWLRDRLRRELTAVLGVADVHLARGKNGQLRLHVVQPENPPVALLDLLPLLPETPPVTTPLGLAEDGRPVLLHLAETDMTPVLLAGEPGAGKTALLRTMAVSLALTNKQCQVQLLIVDGKGIEPESGYSELEPLTYLPHLLMPIIYGIEDAAEVLSFLAEEVAYRGQQKITAPHVVVLIDGIVTLLEHGGQPVADALARLGRRGATAGIHLMMSTRRPDAPVLDDLFKGSFPLRLVGQVGDEQQAVVATGATETQAEHLLGQGDFLAVADKVITHFQGAYIGDYDLHLVLEALHRNRPRPLLAQPISVRATLPAWQEEISGEAEAKPFWVNSRNVTSGAEPETATEADSTRQEYEEPEVINNPLYLKGGRK